MIPPAASICYKSSFVCVNAFMCPFPSALTFSFGLIVTQHAGMFMGFEELEGDDDIREEFPCPFCSEYFDIVGLCCHIDEEHPIEARNGV